MKIEIKREMQAFPNTRSFHSIFLFFIICRDRWKIVTSVLSCRRLILMNSSSHSRLRIAICHPDLGIERLIVDAALELSSRGHYVHVFTAHHDRNRCFEDTINGSFPVTVYGSFLPRHVFRHLHALCAYVRCLWVAMCIVLFSDTFDVVLVDQVSAVIPLLKLKRSSKILFYCHFPDMLLAQHTTSLRRLYRRPIDWIEEATTSRADRILVNSEFTASIFQKTFQRLHAKGIQPTVLYPAVNTQEFASLDKGCSELQLALADIPQLSSASSIVLSINRFERKKNISLAISAFAVLLKQLSSLDLVNGSAISNTFVKDSIKLVLAGGYDKRLAENREYLLELKALTEEKGLMEHVIFVPSCSTVQRNALLAACICVVYTPQEEHFGIVPLEAMAAGKPVIACNSGGPMESIVASKTGFLCEPTPENFSSALFLLLSNSTNAERMGKDAREHVEHNFSRQVFGDRLQSVILQLVQSTAGT
ncbi:hypothetical protein O6H91_05G107500 [Diphasiastrum complanatum]|uniref:Uncharacterized protein n=1 Tax=Diphasiastrum complanatum TaxID=34168 RepID=A0ACC2DS71_DIPCM|nr:hypothetical protein O6H91_05G107500 [Diphasiastrum complanatum]